ncbi:MAG: hypothetical protein IJN91_03470 [Alphaproteobacteria bacterium]|nr:hypothetical protein [Alphaproteobacteria bacterium]
MRKSLVGAILCVMVTYNASASIISRGFFDEAMENYATNTALDLKANQTDLTALSNKIGTLPSGIFPIFSGAERLLPMINEPFTYPTSLAELINAIYGNSETGAHGLLEGIIGGFPYIQYGDDRPDDYIGLIHNFEHARNAKELASANATKIGTVPDGKNLAGMIGTLPDGYDSVGAALTAMDAKITAKNLPSTSDDGQYVLTAKKVGETITYTWVKMDLTNEEQIQ